MSEADGPRKGAFGVGRVNAGFSRLENPFRSLLFEVFMDLADLEPVQWRVKRKSKLERMADRAVVLADLPIGELRRVSGYPVKELRGLSRGQVIAEILENEFLV